MTITDEDLEQAWLDDHPFCEGCGERGCNTESHQPGGCGNDALFPHPNEPALQFHAVCLSLALAAEGDDGCDGIGMEYAQPVTPEIESSFTIEDGRVTEWLIAGVRP